MFRSLASAIALALLPVSAGAAIIAPVAAPAADDAPPALHLPRAIAGAVATVERSGGAVLLTIDAAALTSVAPLEPHVAARLRDLSLDGFAPQADLSAVRAMPGGEPFDADGVAEGRLPEPTTWLMIFFGFFGLAFAVRRRDTRPRARVRFT